MNTEILTDDPTYNVVLVIAFIFVASTVLGAAVMKTPYGRFGNVKYGFKLNPRWGWFLMELPATVSFLYFYFLGSNRFEIVPLIFLCIWMIHYGNRGFLFPWLMRTGASSQKTFNILVVSIGMIVTAIHGYLNGYYISELSSKYSTEWLTDPRFIIGIAIYYLGFFLNLHSDRIIRNLRPADEEKADSSAGRYKIPYGGLFKWVSSPQYLSELIAWTGFAICTWSWGGLFILSISAANLIPRAVATHKWYRDKFEDYPQDRKALIPFL